MLTRTRLILFVTTALILGLIFGTVGTTQLYEQHERQQAMAATLLAQKYQKEGRVDEAVGLLYQATANEPDFYGSYLLLGDIYATLGKHGLAAVMYKESLDRIDKSGKEYSRILSEGGLEHDSEAIRKKLDRSTLLSSSQAKGPER